jgi:hypothetical protein
MENDLSLMDILKIGCKRLDKLIFDRHSLEVNLMLVVSFNGKGS